MNNDEKNQSNSRKTIYDGIRITGRGADIAIAVLSFVLTLIFIFALSKN